MLRPREVLWLLIGVRAESQLRSEKPKPVFSSVKMLLPCLSFMQCCRVHVFDNRGSAPVGCGAVSDLSETRCGAVIAWASHWVPLEQNLSDPRPRKCYDSHSWWFEQTEGEEENLSSWSVWTLSLRVYRAFFLALRLAIQLTLRRIRSWIMFFIGKCYLALPEYI